jgi:hypothetical protein
MFNIPLSDVVGTPFGFVAFTLLLLAWVQLSKQISGWSKSVLTAICVICIGVGLFFAFKPEKPVVPKDDKIHIEQKAEGQNNAVIINRDGNVTIQNK